MFDQLKQESSRRYERAIDKINLNHKDKIISDLESQLKAKDARIR